jgi:hypothetical protein
LAPVAAPIASVSFGVASDATTRAPNSTVPESRPTEESDTENSRVSWATAGPMLPPFHAVPAARRKIATIDRAFTSPPPAAIVGFVGIWTTNPTTLRL